MNILKRTLVGLLVVFLAFGQVTVIPGDWVQGFSSLNTTGSNVYVTGVGTIGQDTSFTRSAAGRYTLYDATASTGVTTLTVRAGAGQASSADVLVVKNSANADQAVIKANGTVNIAGSLSVGGGLSAADGTNFVLPNNGAVLFSSTSTWSGSKDLGLARDAAGRLRVSDGSTGLGQIMIASSTPASAAATCAAGTVVWDSGFVYVCISANTWKRAAIATW